MLPTPDALLATLQQEPHGARMRRMGELGARHRGEEGLSALLDHFEAGSPFEARLGLVATAAARDHARVVHALRSRSNLVRGFASCLALILDDATLTALLLSDSDEDALPEDTRRALLKSIGTSQRQSLADALLEPVRARHGAAEAAALLPACTSPRVEAALPDFDHVPLRWSALARRHPEVVSRFVRAELQTAPRWERESRWEELGPALEELSRIEPQTVLELTQSYSLPSALPRVVSAALGTLLAREPEATLALLCRPTYRPTLEREGLPEGVLRRAAKLSDEQLRTLARALRNAHTALAGLLSELAPSRRGGIFESAFQGVSLAGVHWPDSVLEALPRDLRTREAVRMLELPIVQASRVAQVHLWAFLPVEQVRERFVEASRGPDADERAMAMSSLCACVGRSRAGLTETLKFLRGRLENEQDPVRYSALLAVSALPPSLFEPGHLEALDELLRFVVQSRDSSYGTFVALQRLAMRLLKHGEDARLVQWGLATLRTLAAHQGSLVLGELDELPQDRSTALIDALVPVLQEKEAREYWTLTLLVAEAAGKRGWTHAGLQDCLERATHAKEEWACKSAVSHWLASPRTREERVRALLDRDLSCITLDGPYTCVHERRQDWLDPFLGGQAVRGRFISGKTVYVPSFSSHFYRWNPAQQRRFAALQQRLADDDGQNASTRSSAIQTLARLQVLGLAAMEPYLSSEDVSIGFAPYSEQSRLEASPLASLRAIAEAALGALAHLDQPEETLQLLIDQAGGPNARVAAYALQKAFRHSRPARIAAALDALEQLPQMKLTTRKELPRLRARFRVAGSMERLLAAWSSPTLHRDLRIALLHAAHTLMDGEGAWVMLEAAARHPDRFVADAAIGASVLLVPRARRQRYGRNVLAATRHADLEVRRGAFIGLVNWARGAQDEVIARCVEELADLGSPLWRSALVPLMPVVAEGRGAEALTALAVTLATAEVEEPWRAGAKRDLPHRQRLQELCGRLSHLDGVTRAVLAPALRATATALSAAGAMTWREALSLRVAALDWEEQKEEELQSLLDEAGRWSEGLSTLRTLLRERLSDHTSWTVESMERWVSELSVGRPVGVSLLALDLLQASSARGGWSVVGREALRALRASSSLDVAAAAERVWTAMEP